MSSLDDASDNYHHRLSTTGCEAPDANCVLAHVNFSSLDYGWIQCVNSIHNTYTCTHVYICEHGYSCESGFLHIVVRGHTTRHTVRNTLLRWICMSYRPSLNTFPTQRAAMRVSISGSTYCMSPVASRMMTCGREGQKKKRRANPRTNKKIKIYICSTKRAACNSNYLKDKRLRKRKTCGSSIGSAGCCCVLTKAANTSDRWIGRLLLLCASTE